MKEKKDLPKRSEPIYQEIENFEDYEYTNCIAYEMMIRCPDVLEDREWLINELIPLFNSDKITRDELYEIFYLKDYGVDFFNLAHIDNLERGFFNSKSISFEVFKNNKQLPKESLNYDDLSIKDDVEIKINVHLSRPKLRFVKTPRTICKINFSLPKDELIAYISEIKDEYDKENSIIKSPFELLGGETTKVDENLLIHKGTGKYNKNRVADMFFIYDCIEKGLKKSYILKELDIYHDRYERYTYDTLNNYLKIATELINNLKYKELITGVKNYEKA